MPRWFPALVALLLAVPALHAEGPTADKVGKKIEATALAPFKNKVTAVVFLSFDCPNSTGYSATLADLAATYADKGVRFVGVVAADEDPKLVAEQAKEFKLPFPVVVDEKWALASALKATTTPEAFVLDAGHTLRYRGRIDDGYTARLKKSLTVKTADLRDAIDDVLAGTPVRVPVTKAVGCAIVTAPPPAPSSNEVTFYRDVLPVLQERCQTCHRPGEVGPFSLLTYRQAVKWADDIKAYTQSRDMPPWKPVDGPEYAGDRRLPQKEIDLLAKWVDNGMPAGDMKEAPAAKKFPEGWYLGKPDLVLTVNDDFHVAPSGSDLFRCFVLPTGLTEDQYVIGMEVRPGNPRVVHHTLNFWDTSGKARELEADAKKAAKAEDKDHGPGYSSSMGIGFVPAGGRVGAIGGWAPGQLGRYLPEGTGYFLPKGSDVVLQVHYHRTGRPEVDRTQIGLYFSKKKDVTPFQTIVAAGRVIYLPAKTESTVRGAMWAAEDCTIHSVMPHMHLIGRKVRVSMTPPGESERSLVTIDEWDYNWQETYFFKKPIAVKAGTKFEIEAVFDNTDKNPNNPTNPPRAVFFGEQTTNEMLFGFIGATKEGTGRVRITRDDPNPAKKGDAGGK